MKNFAKMLFVFAVLALMAPGFAVAAGGDCENANDCVTNKPITTISVRPAATAPAVNLTSVGSDNCLGSVSGGAGNGLFSIGGGTTTESVECNRRAYSRRLQELGKTGAAVAILCLNPEVASVTPECGGWTTKPATAKVDDSIGGKDPIVCARTGERC